MKYLYLIFVFLICLSFASASDEELRMVCGGDSELEIYYLAGSASNITEIPREPAVGGGGSSTSILPDIQEKPYVVDVYWLYFCLAVIFLLIVCLIVIIEKIKNT